MTVEQQNLIYRIRIILVGNVSYPIYTLDNHVLRPALGSRLWSALLCLLYRLQHQPS